MQADATNIVRIDYRDAKRLVENLHTYLCKNVFNSQERAQIERLNITEPDWNIYKFAIELITQKYRKCIEIRTTEDAISMEKIKIVHEEPDLPFMRVYKLVDGYKYWSLEIDPKAYQTLQMMSWQSNGPSQFQNLQPPSERPSVPLVVLKQPAEPITPLSAAVLKNNNTHKNGSSPDNCIIS